MLPARSDADLRQRCAGTPWGQQPRHACGVRQRALAGELAFGTVDSWLVWKLTGGRVHATDISNASRTLLFNIHEQKWDEQLCSLFDVPSSMLPEVTSCSEAIGESMAGA